MTADASALVCDPADIGELMASWMEARVGFKETDGPNDGPEIREWLRRVGLSAPAEWCAATVYSAAFESARTLGVVCPAPRTAGALNIFRLADHVCRVDVPRRGDVLVLDHGKGRGHAGVITEGYVEGVGLRWASGNTNAAGSRTGDSLLIKSGDPAKVHHGDLAGYLRFSLAPTRLVA